MSEQKIYPIEKASLRNLNPYLQKYDITDENNIWFAGYMELSAKKHPLIPGFLRNANFVCIAYNNNEGIVLNHTKYGFVERERFNLDNSEFRVYKKTILTWFELKTNQSYLNMVVMQNKDKAKEFMNRFFPHVETRSVSF